jgi:hypothetical protein
MLAYSEGILVKAKTRERSLDAPTFETKRATFIEKGRYEGPSLGTSSMLCMPSLFRESNKIVPTDEVAASS